MMRDKIKREFNDAIRHFEACLDDGMSLAKAIDVVSERHTDRILALEHESKMVDSDIICLGKQFDEHDCDRILAGQLGLDCDEYTDNCYEPSPMTIGDWAKGE